MTDGERMTRVLGPWCVCEHRRVAHQGGECCAPGCRCEGYRPHPTANQPPKENP